MATLKAGFRRATTLPELLIVIFLISLLLGAIIQLLFYGSRRFQKIDRSVTMAMEAAAILNQLRLDVLDSSPDPRWNGSSTALVRESGRITKTGVVLPVLGQKGVQPVTWAFDAASGIVGRETEGTTVRLGQGLVRFFSVKRHGLNLDGGRWSSAEDPAQAETSDTSSASPSAPLSEAGSETVRIWYTLELVLGDRSPPLQDHPQIYQARFFPVLVNRRLHSIWKED